MPSLPGPDSPAPPTQRLQEAPKEEWLYCTHKCGPSLVFSACPSLRLGPTTPNSGTTAQCAGDHSLALRLASGARAAAPSGPCSSGRAACGRSPSRPTARCPPPSSGQTTPPLARSARRPSSVPCARRLGHQRPPPTQAPAGVPSRPTGHSRPFEWVVNRSVGRRGRSPRRRRRRAARRLAGSGDGEPAAAGDADPNGRADRGPACSVPPRPHSAGRMCASRAARHHHR